MTVSKDWEIFEEDVAEYLNGKRQDGSGNSCIAYKKGDIKSNEYLVECKCTGADCYTLSKKIYGKIVDEALNAFRIPLFAARTNKSDYFVGMQLDFPEITADVVIESPRTIKLDGKLDSFYVNNFEVNDTSYDLICWKVEL